MSNKAKVYLGILVVVSIVPITFWVSGVNLTERGWIQGVCFAATVGASLRLLAFVIDEGWLEDREDESGGTVE